MCYCETFKGLFHFAYVCMCMCGCVRVHAYTVFANLRLGFLVKGERKYSCPVMAHGYLQGQFYATFQLLPNFVFSF